MRRRPFALAALLLLLAPFLYFGSATTMQRLLGDGETFAAFLSPWIWLAEQWKHGSFPLWTPHLLGGFPILADPHACLWNPLKDALFLVLPPLVAFNGTVLLYHGIAGTGVLAVAREEGLAAEAGLLGGLVYAFCGFLVGVQGQTAFFMSAAAIPWLFWAVRRVQHRPSVSAVWPGALVVVGLVVSGGLQMVAFALLFAGLYAAYLLAFVCRPGERAGFAARVFGIYVLGLALAAPQLLPTWELKSLSVRDAIDYATFRGKSFDAATLPASLLSSRVGILLHHLGPEGQSHVGPLTLALAGLGAVLAARRAAFWLLLAVLAALLSLGDHTPLYRFMYHVPGYNLFRVAARNVVLLDLALAVAAAYGADLVQRRVRPLGGGARLATIGIALLVYVVAVHLGEVRIFRALLPARGADGLVPLAALASQWGALLLYAVGTLATLLLLLRAGGGRTPALACVLLCGLFLWPYRSWIYAAPIERIEPLLDRASVFPELPPEALQGGRVAMGANAMWINFERRGWDDWRLRYAAAGGPDVNMIHGVSSISAHTPLVPAALARLLGGMSTPGNLSDPRLFSSAALDLLNVRYVLAPHGLAWPDQVFARLQRGGDDRYVTVWQNPRALGLFWPVDALTHESDSEIWKAIEGSSIDFRTTALVTGQSGVDGERHYARPRSLSARYSAADQISLSIDARKGAFLASSIPCYPGWQARADGRSIAIRCVNGLFLGIEIPRSTSSVTLSFRPASFRIGLGIFFLTLSIAPIIGLLRPAAEDGSSPFPS